MSISRESRASVCVAGQTSADPECTRDGTLWCFLVLQAYPARPVSLSPSPHAGRMAARLRPHGLQGLVPERQRGHDPPAPLPRHPEAHGRGGLVLIPILNERPPPVAPLLPPPPTLVPSWDRPPPVLCDAKATSAVAASAPELSP